MSSLIRRILINQSTRIIFLIFIFFVSIVVYFLIYNYTNQIDLYKQIQYDRMNSIVRTLSISIDGDTHNYLMKTHKTKDAIKTNEEDHIYESIHKRLKKIQQINRVESTIYTLVYDSASNTFQYGISSTSPFFRHQYKKYPPILKEKFKEGAIIPLYETENGTWISAFAPILNNENKVVAIVEADVKFNDFITKARAKVFKSLALSLVFIVIIGFFLYRSIKKILRKEEEVKRYLIRQKQEIEEKNKDIVDSINYSKKIQDSFFPSKDQINNCLVNNFIFFKPRDIVSGDFYWHHEFEDGSQVFAVSDCTGHGVPGAMMSVIGCTLLNEIVKINKCTRPDFILEQLDNGIEKFFKNENSGNNQLDGMDISTCYVDSSKKILKYAGAFRQLVMVRNNILTEFKANRFPIGGGGLYSKSKFDLHKIDIQKDDQFFMFTDGYVDQFGGDNGKKIGAKNFKELLLEVSTLETDKQEKRIAEFFSNWKGKVNQIDDVLIFGFAFK